MELCEFFDTCTENLNVLIIWKNHNFQRNWFSFSVFLWFLGKGLNTAFCGILWQNAEKCSVHLISFRNTRQDCSNSCAQNESGEIWSRKVFSLQRILTCAQVFPENLTLIWKTWEIWLSWQPTQTRSHVHKFMQQIVLAQFVFIGRFLYDLSGVLVRYCKLQTAGSFLCIKFCDAQLVK